MKKTYVISAYESGTIAIPKVNNIALNEDGQLVIYRPNSGQFVADQVKFNYTIQINKQTINTTDNIIDVRPYLINGKNKIFVKTTTQIMRNNIQTIDFAFDSSLLIDVIIKENIVVNCVVVENVVLADSIRMALTLNENVDIENTVIDAPLLKAIVVKCIKSFILRETTVANMKRYSSFDFSVTYHYSVEDQSSGSISDSNFIELPLPDIHIDIMEFFNSPNLRQLQSISFDVEQSNTVSSQENIPILLKTFKNFLFNKNYKLNINEHVGLDYYMISRHTLNDIDNKIISDLDPLALNQV